jgi:hypothetical protein
VEEKYKEQCDQVISFVPFDMWTLIFQRFKRHEVSLRETSTHGLHSIVELRRNSWPGSLGKILVQFPYVATNLKKLSIPFSNFLTLSNLEKLTCPKAKTPFTDHTQTQFLNLRLSTREAIPTRVSMWANRLQYKTSFLRTVFFGSREMESEHNQKSDPKQVLSFLRICYRLKVHYAVSTTQTFRQPNVRDG